MITAGRWRSRVLTIAIVLLGLTATGGAAMGFDQSLERDTSRRFDAAAERARAVVGARLQLYDENLAQLRNWMLVNPDLTRAEFHELTRLGFEQGLYPGVQAVSYAHSVPREQLERFAADVQAEIAAADYPPFAVHPPSDGPVAYVITFLEPLAGNEEAFAFDLATDPVRLRAIEAARDRGNPVGSGPVELVQGSAGQAGFIVWSPVYDTGDIPNTAPARRRHFLGVLTMVFRAGDMFAGVLGDAGEVDAELYDLGPTTDPAETRYDASNRLFRTKDAVAVSPDGEVRGPHRNLDLNIGDRRWRMVVTPASGFATNIGIQPTVVWVLGGIVTMLLASITHSTSVARGRAERRALEMTVDLRSAEERSRSILQGAPDSMLVIDGNGTITSVNLAAEVLFGYSAEALEGQPVEVLLPEHLRDVHRSHRAGFVAAPRRREMGASLDLLGRRCDGTTFPLEVSLSPLQGSDGSLEVIATVRDVSQRRAAQASLQTAYDREREITEQLRKAEELMTTFLSTISHELRTPLTAISGFADLLVTMPLPPEQRDDYLRRVRRNAQSLDTLIDEVLAFARLQRGEALDPTLIDLHAEVQLIVQQLAPVLDSHEIVISASETVFAHLDRAALTRILTNILNNASRYSPPGTTITVSIERHGEHSLLAVTDAGPGIPPDEQDRVFERFYRGPTALRARVPGTGIGLAVVKDLTERSGGSVKVTSAEGSGARFEVKLPLASAPQD